MISTKTRNVIPNDIYEMKHMLNCGYEIKRSYDPCSYERNFSEEKAEKFSNSTRFEPVTSQCQFFVLTN